MSIAQKVINQSPVLSIRFSTASIAHSSSLDDTFVASQIVDKTYISLVQDRELFIEDFFSFRDYAVGHAIYYSPCVSPATSTDQQFQFCTIVEFSCDNTDEIELLNRAELELLSTDLIFNNH